MNSPDDPPSLYFDRSTRHTDAIRPVHSISLLQFGLERCQPEWIVREAGSSFHRIVHVFGGEIWYTGAAGRTTLSPGSLYLFPNRRPYTIEHNPRDPFVCMWFHVEISPAALIDLVEAPVVQSTAMAHALALLHSMIREPRHHELIADQIRTLIGLLGERIWDFSKVDERIKRILMMIERAPAQELSLDELAESCHLEKSYLVRLFKKTVGIPPMQYSLNCRLKKAEELLRGGATVKDAAYGAGFDNVNSFYKIYRKRNGIAPSLSYVPSTGP